MSVPVLILGDSGSGKSRSMKNLDPAKTLVIQPIKKPLPFRSVEWMPFAKENKNGAIYHCNDYQTITKVITVGVRAGKKTIVIDDSNYLLTMSELKRSGETGFGKFLDFAKNHADLVFFLQSLPDDVCVYVMSHTQLDVNGHQRPKTTGKMLDEKICLEGLFSIVIGCHVKEGRHYFTTKNSGSDCVKTPEDMFESDEIENDLAEVNKAITSYYS